MWMGFIRVIFCYTRYHYHSYSLILMNLKFTYKIYLFIWLFYTLFISVKYPWYRDPSYIYSICHFGILLNGIYNFILNFFYFWKSGLLSQVNKKKLTKDFVFVFKRLHDFFCASLFILNSFCLFLLYIILTTMCGRKTIITE